jgi:hypothetical protein
MLLPDDGIRLRLAGACEHRSMCGTLLRHRLRATTARPDRIALAWNNIGQRHHGLASVIFKVIVSSGITTNILRLPPGQRLNGACKPRGS